MHFCIFSYNRGQHLQNCLESIEHCAPDLEVTIYDDDSDDPATKEALRKASKKYQVINTREDSTEIKKLGGLYNNMEQAVKQLSDKDTLCFLQDDMQLVRAVDQNDLDDIEDYFASNPESAFLHPAFLKGSNRTRDYSTMNWNEKANAYFRNAGKQSVGVHFSAIVIIKTQRLKTSNWKFKSREKDNDLRAQTLFGKMGFMKNPFLIWVPNVPVFRGKSKTFGIRLAEKIYKSGFYPMAIMSDVENSRFRRRNTDKLPITEDFLKLRDNTLKKPWRHHPLAGNKLLKFIHKLELRWRSHILKR